MTIIIDRRALLTTGAFGLGGLVLPGGSLAAQALLGGQGFTAVQQIRHKIAVDHLVHQADLFRLRGIQHAAGVNEVFGHALPYPRGAADQDHDQECGDEREGRERLAAAAVDERILA